MERRSADDAVLAASEALRTRGEPVYLYRRRRRRTGTDDAAAYVISYEMPSDTAYVAAVPGDPPDVIAGRLSRLSGDGPVRTPKGQPAAGRDASRHL